MKKGDQVKCLGIGYPGMKDKVFEVTVVFNDNTFGIMIDGHGIRLQCNDFVVIERDE